MENLRTEELLNEETVEAVTPVVEQAVENVAKAGIDWKKVGKYGVVVAGVAAGAYGVYKLYKNHKAKNNVDEVEEDVVVDAECKEASEEGTNEETEK